MGNANSRRSSAINKRSGSKKEKPSSEAMDNLSGWEINVDTMASGFVSELFEVPPDGMDTSHSATELGDTSNHTIRPAGSMRRSDGSHNRKCGSSKRSSTATAVDSDLVACIIPGMDPRELLQLVEECAHEEMREQELEGSSRRQDIYRKSRDRKSRKRNKNGLSPTAA